METSLNRSNEKDTIQVKLTFPFFNSSFFFNQNDDERVKILTETMEKLRISVRIFIHSQSFFLYCFEK